MGEWFWVRHSGWTFVRPVILIWSGDQSNRQVLNLWGPWLLSLAPINKQSSAAPFPQICDHHWMVHNMSLSLALPLLISVFHGPWSLPSCHFSPFLSQSGLWGHIPALTSLWCHPTGFPAGDQLPSLERTFSQGSHMLYGRQCPDLGLLSGLLWLATLMVYTFSQHLEDENWRWFSPPEWKITGHQEGNWSGRNNVNKIFLIY